MRHEVPTTNILRFMTWSRADLRSDFLSFQADFFTSHKPLKTSETSMYYMRGGSVLFVSY